LFPKTPRGALYLIRRVAPPVSEVPPTSANWKIIGKNEDLNVPEVNENTIRDSQKAKYAGKKGQYRKAHLMFSSRRIMSVKMIDQEIHSKCSFVKANILKSYTGSISRPVTIMFNQRP